MLLVITGYPVVIIVGFFANDQKQFPLNSSGRHRELFSIAPTMLGPSSRRLEQTRSFQMFSSHHIAAATSLVGARSTKRGQKGRDDGDDGIGEGGAAMRRRRLGGSSSSCLVVISRLGYGLICIVLSPSLSRSPLSWMMAEEFSLDLGPFDNNRVSSCFTFLPSKQLCR